MTTPGDPGTNPTGGGGAPPAPGTAQPPADVANIAAALASALQQASSTATGTTPWQPPKPINGGVVQVRTDEYVAWTGGKRRGLRSAANQPGPNVGIDGRR